MTDQHPITPPPELVKQWIGDYFGCSTESVSPSEKFIATQATRWGADQELEACVNYVDNNVSGNRARALREHRRPKPPSLKEQALKALERWAEDEHGPGAVFHRGLEVGLIRRALVEQQ